MSMSGPELCFILTPALCQNAISTIVNIYKLAQLKLAQHEKIPQSLIDLVASPSREGERAAVTPAQPEACHCCTCASRPAA